MFWYRVARRAFRIVATPMFRFRVEGSERVPENGPGVLVAAHRSWLDPACVAGACSRPIRFLILDRVYRMRRANWFYRAMESIPVTAGSGSSTRALRVALRSLRSGELVGVFPQGRVVPEGDFSGMHPGAALLAIRSQAPVIPLHIAGSAKAWPHGRSWPSPALIQITVGHPIQPPAPGGRDEVARLLGRIELGLRGLAEGGAGCEPS